MRREKDVIGYRGEVTAIIVRQQSTLNPACSITGAEHTHSLFILNKVDNS